MPSSSIIWALEQAIFNELSSDVEIAANVVGIYHLQPTNSNRPFIYLRVDGVDHITTVLSSGYKVVLSILIETDSRSSEKILNILGSVVIFYFIHWIAAAKCRNDSNRCLSFSNLENNLL